MQRDPRAYLWDVQEAAAGIAEFTRGKELEDYLADRMLRSAIVGFRNILIHGYAAVNHSAVWKTIHVDLPKLQDRAAGLMGELGSKP